MTARRPLCRVNGRTAELPLGDKPGGSWAKTVPVAAGGAVSVTIPAGIFAGLPVIGHTIQAAGTRDYVFRLSGVTLNPDKTITIAGTIRESKVLAVLGETFGALTSALTLHLSAEESD